MQKKLSYIIHKNDPVNRWLYTDISCEPYFSDIDTFEEEMNLTEEYVQIEYPVRKQFLKERKNKTIERFDGDYNNIYIPFENPRVEFSSFISNPHVLQTYAKTFIIGEENETIPLIITTCGGVEIWVNGEHQVSFLPFTRNQPSRNKIELNLKKGENEIIVYFDDLAERDVNYFFELRYIGNRSLEGYIPVMCPPERIIDAENLLDNIYFVKDLFTEGFVELSVNGEKIKSFGKVHVRINHTKLINPVFGLAEHNDLKQAIYNGDSDFWINIKEHLKNNILSIGRLEEFNVSGMTHFDIGLQVCEGLIVYRRLVASLYNKEKYNLKFDRSIEKRKKEALSFLSSLSLNDLNRGIANAVIYNNVDELTKDLIRSCFSEIREKSDCADFRLAPLLAFTIKYQSILPNDLKHEIKELAINFRYWIDEPGNDVMWYFSENHALLFHVSQYLAGYLYPNDLFVVSNRLGIKQYEIGREKLKQWFDIFFKYGLAEWNSTTYIPIDLIGFFSLYMSAPDDDIRDLAKKALDLIFKLIAVNLHGKTMATTYGRVYEHDLKAMESGEISNLVSIAWNKGFLNKSFRASVLFCISDYQPPSLQHLINIPKGKAVLSEYVQGIKKVYTYVYKTNKYTIAGAINFNAYRKGHQQHTMNVALDDDNTQIWINHPGEYVFSGENRPSFWAGNGICPNIRQYRNCMLIDYKLQQPYIEFVHAYIPFWKLDEIIEEGKWFFVRKNESYLALYFDRGYTWIKEKAVAFREVRAYGDRHRIIVRCSSKDEIQSFENFKEKILLSTINIENSQWSYKDFDHGELKLDQDGELYVNSKKIEYKADYNISSKFLNI